MKTKPEKNNNVKNYAKLSKSMVIIYFLESQ